MYHHVLAVSFGYQAWPGIVPFSSLIINNNF